MNFCPNNSFKLRVEVKRVTTMKIQHFFVSLILLGCIQYFKKNCEFWEIIAIFKELLQHCSFALFTLLRYHNFIITYNFIARDILNYCNFIITYIFLACHLNI